MAEWIKDEPPLPCKACAKLGKIVLPTLENIDWPESDQAIVGGCDSDVYWYECEACYERAGTFDLPHEALDDWNKKNKEGGDVLAALDACAGEGIMQQIQDCQGLPPENGPKTADLDHVQPPINEELKNERCEMTREKIDPDFEAYCKICASRVCCNYDPATKILNVFCPKCQNITDDLQSKVDELEAEIKRLKAAQSVTIPYTPELTGWKREGEGDE